MTQLDRLVSAFANLMWGPFLLILLVGGGLYFTVYCRFTPFRYFRHGLDILFGKFDRDNLQFLEKEGFLEISDDYIRATSTGLQRLNAILDRLLN